MTIYRYPEDPNSFLVEIDKQWFYIWEDKISKTDLKILVDQESFGNLHKLRQDHFIPVWLLTAVVKIQAKG